MKLCIQRMAWMLNRQGFFKKQLSKVHKSAYTRITWMLIHLYILISEKRGISEWQIHGVWGGEIIPSIWKRDQIELVLQMIISVYAQG